MIQEPSLKRTIFFLNSRRDRFDSIVAQGPSRSEFFSRLLEEVIQQLLTVKWPCEVFVDGSYFTEKPDPGAVGKGPGELVELICPTAKAKYFLREGWTGQITLKRFSKFAV